MFWMFIVFTITETCHNDLII